MPLSTATGNLKIFSSFGGCGFTLLVGPPPVLLQKISTVLPSESSLILQAMSIGCWVKGAIGGSVNLNFSLGLADAPPTPVTATRAASVRVRISVRRSIEPPDMTCIPEGSIMPRPPADRRFSVLDVHDQRDLAVGIEAQRGPADGIPDLVDLRVLRRVRIGPAAVVAVELVDPALIVRERAGKDDVDLRDRRHGRDRERALLARLRRCAGHSDGGERR